MTVDELLKGLLQGESRSLSRAITLAESRLSEKRQVAREILARCPETGDRSLRIGISGSPGVGKSTFIEQFGQYLLERSPKLAILAIDPSSSVNKGSILGDKTRMPELSRDPRVFIRPSPNGKTLGGVAKATREAISLCEAAGYESILIETVGVGQSEIQVSSMVDIFITLYQPNSGDDLQGMKKGILELADMIIVTKDDRKDRSQILRTLVDLKAATQLVRSTSNQKDIPILSCSSLENTGFDKILVAIDAIKESMLSDGSFAERRRRQSLSWFEREAESCLLEKIEGLTTYQEKKAKLIAAIVSHQMTASAALEHLDETVHITMK